MDPNKLTNELLKDFEKTELQKELIAIILYGSRATGFSTEESDYDLIIIFKNPMIRPHLQNFKNRYSKAGVDIVYWISQEELILKLNSSISLYNTLINDSQHIILYKTKTYDRIKKLLKTIRPTKKLYKEYIKKKKTFLIKSLTEREGTDATKWAYHTIRSLLQLIVLMEKNAYSGDIKLLLKHCKKITQENKRLIELIIRKNENKAGISEKEKQEVIILIETLYKIIS